MGKAAAAHVGTILAWVAIACAGCSTRSDSVICGDTKVCSAGTTCVVVSAPDQEVCARPEQLAVCKDKPNYTHCDPDGRCYDGVCLSIACGNGRVDRPDPAQPGDVGEACDDGNQTSGDGCASNCRSDETCGNHVLDPINGELCDDGNLIQHDGCDSTCKLEKPRWTTLDVNGPSQRTLAAMAYDARRGRVVMFGGQDAVTSDPLGDTWEWDGNAWAKRTPEHSPVPRAGASMAYDATRRRIVLFGGSTDDYLSDTWEWDGSDWTQRLQPVSPRGRYLGAMVFDEARHRMVLNGGTGHNANTIGIFKDTWEWDGAAWIATNLAVGPVGQPAETLAMAYDPVHARTIAFSGTETWSYDGQGWTRVATTGPPARFGGAMAYDAMTRRLLLFGGTAGGTVLGDSWAWNGQTWTQLVSPSPPSPRDELYLATDLTRRRIVLFGGELDSTTYEWDGARWQSIAPTPPPALKGLTAAYDPLRGRATMFDGTTTWELVANSWVKVLTEPLTLGLDQVVYDEAVRATLRYFEITGLTARWDGTSWIDLPSGSAPLVQAPAMGWDGNSGRIILFGGVQNLGSTVDDTWAWNGTWTMLSPAHRPAARSDAAMAWDPIRKELVMSGGHGNTLVLADTWVWTGDDWVQRTPAVTPGAQDKHRLAWLPSRQRLVAFAGETWEWDGTTWLQLLVPSRPIAHAGYVLVRTNDGTGLILYGGTSSGIGGTTDMSRFGWDGTGTDEACRDDVDDDGDHLAGCADPDCWTVCAPTCPPGATCDPAAPRCGDGICNTALENCRICPGDCSCTPVCGDYYCDPGETAATCPGDCP